MNSTYDHQFLTPAQAAKRAGVSRPTINRALKSHELQGHRDNKNRWKIAKDDLDKWVERRRAVHDEQVVTTERPVFTTTTDEQLDHLRTQLADAREKLAGETARADAAERDRDAWKTMADKLTDRGKGWKWPWQ